MQGSLAHYVLAYLFWLITCALAVVVALTARGMYQILLAFDFAQRYVARAVDDFAILVLGIIILLSIVLCEHYYRTGVQNRKLLARFCLLTMIELGLIALFHLVTFGAKRSYGQFDRLTLSIAAAEFLGALIFGWLYRWLQTQKQSNPA